MPTYTARWLNPDLTDRANVSFDARSDYHASQQADKIAREVDSVNSPRVLSQGFKVIQHLNTGVNKE